MVATDLSTHFIRRFTQQPDVARELLAYIPAPFTAEHSAPAVAHAALADEPQTTTWKQYVAEAQTDGVFPTLRRYLVQLQFPIVAGISKTEEYRRAVRKGVVQRDNLTDGLALKATEGMQLYLHDSLAGAIPVLVIPNRGDFESIVQALVHRNEPQPLPASMGAALIKGLNNWGRVRRLQREWAGMPNPNAWIKQKELYQDTLIVLSRIPYSNVSATQMGIAEEKWLDQSLSIRLAHECAHYFTLRHYGKMQVNMYDELLADYLGICAVTKHFHKDWFLRFIGLEHYPALRADGRLHNYLGQPPLSAEAREVLQVILYEAAQQVEIFDQRIRNEEDPQRLYRLQALASLDLLEMAAPDGHQRLLYHYQQLQVTPL